jgi:DNA-binding GntR family transcriptional regulator
MKDRSEKPARARRPSTGSEISDLQVLQASDVPAPRSLGDLARDRFLAALFERRLEPGAFVSQNELVKLLEVPVGPLRDALRVLQT